MMTERSTRHGANPPHVSLVAIPDAVVSTLFGIYDVLSAFTVMDGSRATSRAREPFRVDIVGESAGSLTLASGVPDDGLAPYIVFEGKSDHGDAEIQGAQQWLRDHFSVANPVEEMIRRSALAERTFTRRFTSATGLTPLAYVQRLRIEEAKRHLERTDASVDEISWRVGYEDAAFFRRLFKRTTGLAPGAYRKRFRIPQFARS